MSFQGVGWLMCDKPRKVYDSAVRRASSGLHSLRFNRIKIFIWSSVLLRSETLGSYVELFYLNLKKKVPRRTRDLIGHELKHRCSELKHHCSDIHSGNLTPVRDFLLSSSTTYTHSSPLPYSSQSNLITVKILSQHSI